MRAGTAPNWIVPRSGYCYTVLGSGVGARQSIDTLLFFPFSLMDIAWDIGVRGSRAIHHAHQFISSCKDFHAPTLGAAYRGKVAERVIYWLSTRR